MPHDDQHAIWNGLDQMQDADIWIVLVDREQRRERDSKTGGHHRLNRAVVVGTEHDPRLDAESRQELLGQDLVPAGFERDHRGTVEVGYPSLTPRPGG